MRVVLVLIPAFLVLCLAAEPADGAGHFQGGLNFAIGDPQGDFGEKVENNGFGIGGQFAVGIPGAFVSAGASFGYLVYGSETRSEPFSTTIPDVTVDVKTTNSLVTGHFMLRLQPIGGVVRPYADGLLGFHHLTTDTEIVGEDYEKVVSSNNIRDTALSYGGGGGMMILVYQSPGQPRVIDVFLDAGVRYLKGGEAEYLKEGSIRRDGGRVSYEVEQSNTDLLFVHIGVSVAF